VSVVIAAAGTGGHVYPALAVADELRSLGLPRDGIRFFGGDRMEARTVPAAGYPFEAFPLARFERSITPRNLLIPFTVARTTRAMSAAMRRAGATAVLGMGGYVSVPAVLAARRAGIPFFLQEQNAAPGLASRFAARRARTVFVGLPGRSESLRSAELVGNPLRAEIEAFDRPRLRPGALLRYGLSTEGPIVGILGGSLGARVLNRAAPDIVSAVRSGSVLHLTGRTPEAQIDVAARASDGARWVRWPFEAEMEHFYAAVDLVVCRAGAMTVSELAATGTPSILVPHSRGGQRANAAALGERGGAVVLEQGSIGGVGDIVAAVLADTERLRAMASAAGEAARPGAAAAIAAALAGAADA
jgi:UDP-N-acetylglucosamine--N-acetylmuramyl-(pentapeptide) pyrophosphoryl-undecaprenol N-acetylglucosamine transferase